MLTGPVVISASTRKLNLSQRKLSRFRSFDEPVGSKKLSSHRPSSHTAASGWSSNTTDFEEALLPSLNLLSVTLISADSSTRSAQWLFFQRDPRGSMSADHQRAKNGL